MSESLRKAVAKYIALRDEKKALAAVHKEELAPLNEAMLKIENAVQRLLLSQGALNMKTPSGTAYLSTTTKATIQDWSVFRAYMLEHDLLDMMEQRVSMEAVREFKEANGGLPPGIATTDAISTRFKR